MDNDSTAKFDKLKIATRYWLIGASAIDSSYHSVSQAFEFGLAHHDGLRNGGAPEFIHQLRIFNHARNHIRSIRNPPNVFKLIFLHDAVEDPNQKTGKFVSPEEINERFGLAILWGVQKLSKNILGQPNPEYSLDAIFADQDCSIAKALDRVDNLQGLVDVFKKPRAFRYIKETEEDFIPRLSIARRMFPQQEGIYEDAKMQMQKTLHLSKKILGYDDPPETSPA